MFNTLLVQFNSPSSEVFPTFNFSQGNSQFLETEIIRKYINTIFDKNNIFGSNFWPFLKTGIQNKVGKTVFLLQLVAAAAFFL